MNGVWRKGYAVFVYRNTARQCGVIVALVITVTAAAHAELRVVKIATDVAVKTVLVAVVVAIG